MDAGRTIKATVLSLSEGGLSLDAALEVEQGDSIRLRILPHRRARTVTVDAIVWNALSAVRSRSGAGLRSLGCVISDPPAAFLALIDEQERRDPPGVPKPARRATSAASSPERTADLPRSRVPLPPPKPEADESFPRFRVRLKQVGGPRTRILSARACSMVQAAERA